MFPIVSISNLITVPFLLLISLSLFVSFRHTKNKNIGYFFAGMLSTTIMGIVLSSPGLIFKDLKHIATVFAFYPFLIFIGLGFFGTIPFSILKKKNLEIAFLVILIIIAFSATLINLNNVRDAVVYENPPFIYWEDTRGATMNIFTGVLAGVILIFVSLFFFINGLKSSDSYIRARSFLISRGMAVFFAGAIINFVLGASYSTYKYLGSTIASFLIILSSVLIFIGIRQKNKSQKEEEPRIQW